MEKKGAINQYERYVPPAAYNKDRVGEIERHSRGRLSVFPPVFTINLAAGVTPFMRHFNGVEYASCFYTLTVRSPVVTHANYRPSPAVFGLLNEEEQEWVLGAHLLCDELSVAAAQSLDRDQVAGTWGFEQFQQMCLAVYGRRLSKSTAPPS